MLKYKYNGYLIAYYLFQYSLLIPFMAFVEPSLVIALSSIVTMLLTLYVNKKSFSINKLILFFIFFFCLILTLKLIIQNNSPKIFFCFFAFSFPGLLLISLNFDRRYFLNLTNKFAILNFIINFLNPFWTNGYARMRFGYGMVPTIIFSYLFIQDKKRTDLARIYTIVFYISLFEIVVFGARGSVFTVICFILMDKIFIRKIGMKVVLLFIGLFGIYEYIRIFLMGFISLIYKIGMKSYILFKFNMMLKNQFEESSSGRFDLYRDTINNILQSPYIGNPFFQQIDDQPFVHNIYLQIANDLGIFALIIFLLFVLLCIFMLLSKKINDIDKIVLNIFMVISMGRLTFSSTLWMRPEFWLFVGFAFLLMHKRKETKYVR